MNEFEKQELNQDEELTQEEILMNEPDILAGILACAGAKNSDESYTTVEVRQAGTTRRLVKYDEKPIKLNSGEKVLLRFRIRGLDQSEYVKCKDDATKYMSNKKMGGIKMPVDMNTVKFYDLIIFTATHPEDKEKIWNNKAAWTQLGGIMTGSEMVSKLLYAGEKDALIELIDNKSGFGEDSLEEVAKK